MKNYFLYHAIILVSISTAFQARADDIQSTSTKIDFECESNTCSVEVFTGNDAQSNFEIQEHIAGISNNSKEVEFVAVSTSDANLKTVVMSDLQNIDPMLEKVVDTHEISGNKKFISKLGENVSSKLLYLPKELLELSQPLSFEEKTYVVIRSFVSGSLVTSISVMAFSQPILIAATLGVLTGVVASGNQRYAVEIMNTARKLGSAYLPGYDSHLAFRRAYGLGTRFALVSLIPFSLVAGVQLLATLGLDNTLLFDPYEGLGDRLKFLYGSVLTSHFWAASRRKILDDNTNADGVVHPKARKSVARISAGIAIMTALSYFMQSLGGYEIATAAIISAATLSGARYENKKILYSIPKYGWKSFTTFASDLVLYSKTRNFSASACELNHQMLKNQ